MVEQQPNDATSYRSGSNQIAVKQFNERLIIDIVATSNGISKADITRLTGLSAQTVTTIVNRLIHEEILFKGDVIKGKVGQPSTLIELNDAGATAIGIKIGRRSANVLMVGLTAKVAMRRSFTYQYPDHNELFHWIGTTVAEMIDTLSDDQKSKFIGIGVAAPFELDGWEGVISAPAGEMIKWKNIDIAKEVGRITNQQTFLLNDATAACLAELRMIGARQNASFLYFYVGTFLGGGVVLDGKILNGNTGNAGSVGSIPTSLADENKPAQMVNAAAIHELEVMCIKHGLARDTFAGDRDFTKEELDLFDKWAEAAGNSLAYAILSGQSFFDLDDVVIDGSLRHDLMEKLVATVETCFARYDTQGLRLPQVRVGNLGNDARAIGGSFLPIYEQFGLDQSVIFKSYSKD
ncbi:ROK family transcriptional regulator [Alphaproteobacteria bacterium]|nr:ROK family transcriptional regulator [Alphaproteobacteria bacterium]